jgi:hypothetical protein
MESGDSGRFRETAEHADFVWKKRRALRSFVDIQTSDRQNVDIQITNTANLLILTHTVGCQAGSVGTYIIQKVFKYVDSPPALFLIVLSH